jgi:hypothetical protein
MYTNIKYSTDTELEDKITAILKHHFYFVKAYKFLNAGEDNRAIAAYEAYRKKTSWDYSFSLEAVVCYEKQKQTLDHNLLELIKDKDTVDSIRLRGYVKNQIHQTTLCQEP